MMTFADIQTMEFMAEHDMSADVYAFMTEHDALDYLLIRNAYVIPGATPMERQANLEQMFEDLDRK